MVIVASVDRSGRAADVISEAQELAVAFDDSVHVVHVMTNAELVKRAESSVEQTGKGVEFDEAKRPATEAIEDAPNDVDVPVEAIGLVGDPASEIIKYARDENARYVVVGPRKRSPTGKAMFGSVAQSVLLNADCPVLTTTEGKSV